MLWIKLRNFSFTNSDLIHIGKKFVVWRQKLFVSLNL